MLFRLPRDDSEPPFAVAEEPGCRRDSRLHRPKPTWRPGYCLRNGLPARAGPVRGVTDTNELDELDGLDPAGSHGDVDQKNIIATGQDPVLCDWDVALPVVPRRELADVAMSMGCWRDMDVALEVVGAYREHGGDGTSLAPADLAQPMMSGIDWIAMNADRALGRWPASAAETARARELLPGLLAAVPAELALALRITELLRI